MTLFQDTFFYSLAKWGQRLSTMILAPFVIAYFTPQQYGYMSLINTLASFFSVLGMLAIVDQGLPRFFIDSKSEMDKQGYTTSSFFISGIGILATTIMILSGSVLVPFFFRDVETPVLFSALTALTCLAYSIRHVGGNMLKWTFQASIFTKITLVQVFVVVVLTLMAIMVWGWRANAVLLISAIVTFCCGVWALQYCWQFVKPSSFSTDKAKELIAYSWPLLGLNIFAFFTRSLDRIFLASLTSLGTVGIFAVSAAVASVFETLVSGFFFAWGPFILSTFREKASPQRYADFFGVTTCIGLISIVFLGFWGSPIVMLIRPEGTYLDIGIYIPWIISGTLLYYLGGYFTPGPSISKKTYWKFIGFALAAVINAILNYLLIPKWGILGAGVATTLASLAAAIFNIVVSNRLYYIPSKWQVACILVLGYTLTVSLLQHHRFTPWSNQLPLSWRMIYTIGLTSLAIFIYFRDIKAVGVVQKIWK